MLRSLKQREIKAAAKLAYNLSLNKATNSYTLRESFHEYEAAFNYAFDALNYELLGYFNNKELIAVISFYTLKKDLYLQTNAVFIKTESETVLTEFINYLKVKYSGYEVFSGYPKENELIIAFLLKQDFQIIESSIDMRLKRSEFTPSNIINPLIKTNHDNYFDFAEFHDKKALDVYWNSQRIKADFENWIIYAYCHASKVRASITIKRNVGEIFSLLIDEEIANIGIESDLITTSLRELFADPNIEEVVFFIDSDDKKAYKYTKNLGFYVYSNYCCLSTKLT